MGLRDDRTAPWYSAAASGEASSGEAAPAPALRAVEAFGSNPGALRCHAFVPDGLARRSPCVVVLHGCGQTAAGFDAASGWSRLAAAHGFLLLYPEQTVANNSRTCFSWFETDDVTRGRGEVESIRQMVDWAAAEHGTGPVFACGLSAGGAMAAAMLATYPECFAAGAVVAGLPYGAAAGAAEALQAMRVGRLRDPRKWGDRVRAASPHADSSGSASWPGVAIWSGTADEVVRPINAEELVKQWTDVHGVGAREPHTEPLGGDGSPGVTRRITRRTWRDGEGAPRVTAYSVPGLGHGWAVDDAASPAPFFLPAGIAMTRQIAADFGLLDRAGAEAAGDSVLGRVLSRLGMAR